MKYDHYLDPAGNYGVVYSSPPIGDAETVRQLAAQYHPPVVEIADVVYAADQGVWLYRPRYRDDDDDREAH